MSELKTDFIELTKEIVLSLIDKKTISVFLFGSRASRDERFDSDIDIGLWSEEKIDISLIREISDAIEESIVPFHIDIIDFSKVNSQFKKIATKNIIIWNKGKNFTLS